MNTEFGEKLQNAIKSKDTEMVWIDKSGKAIKMATATPEELKLWHHHCDEMLHNTDRDHPGKVVLQHNINRAWADCNAELFVRDLIYNYNTPLKIRKDILEFINAQKDQHEDDISKESISCLFTNLDPIYEKITVNDLINACLGTPIFNKKMINDRFLLAQGIWLTNDEKNELTETDENGNMRDHMEVAKERLCLKNPGSINLQFKSGGLSFHEFRSVFSITPYSRISELSTIAVRTLRDKVLLMISNDLSYHITKWTRLMKAIESIATERGINLDE